MTHTVEIRPSARRIEHHSDESLLQSALNAGPPVDYRCSNGNCCKRPARLGSGRGEHQAYPYCVFLEVERANGVLLTSFLRAASDVGIDT